MAIRIVTDERCTEYFFPGHPERPARILNTLAKLRQQTELQVDYVKPLEFDEELLRRAHSDAHLRLLKSPHGHFHPDTPAHPEIFQHAVRSVGGVLRAMDLARKGHIAFSLMRPPGHHAKRDMMMGFCYLNSIAVTVLEGLAMGVSNLAVFDFDVHHGNGTEAILVNQPHATFFSVHQHPCYPGTGTKNVGNNCFNYPVPPHTPRREYRAVLAKCFEDLKRTKPDLVAVSAGFDAYVCDSIAQEELEVEDFYWIGRMIRRSGIPSFSMLEGGYSDELPDLIMAYLRGLHGR
jgi:acetoin utilization deacetylase AcuC-like enzyme